MTGLSFVKLRGFVALLYHAPKRDTRESGRNPPGFQGAQRPPPPSAAEEGRPQHLDQHLAEGDPRDLLSCQDGQLRHDLFPGGEGEGPQLTVRRHRRLHRVRQGDQLLQAARLGLFQ